MLAKEDWVAYKNSTPYREFDAVLREAIGTYGAELVNRETSNPDRDMFVRGAIKALIEVLEWEPELVSEEEQEA